MWIYVLCRQADLHESVFMYANTDITHVHACMHDDDGFLSFNTEDDLHFQSLTGFHVMGAEMAE